MDKKKVQQEFDDFHAKYTMITGTPFYSKDDLLNFYLQGRKDANEDILKLIKP